MTFNWPILLFGVTMLGLVAGFIVSRMALFIPLVALVLYLGVEFNLWQGLVWIFWIFVILSILAIPVGLFRPVRRFIRITGSIALAVAVLAVSFGTWSWDDSRFGDDNEDTEESTSAPTTSTTTTTSTTVPAADLDLDEEESQQIAGDLNEIFVGYAPGEVDMGTGNIPDSPEERAADVSFTKETIETREDLCTFFASNHEKASDARANVERALREAGYGDDEVNRALNSDCASWLWVAPTVDSQILGTTYSVNGEVVQSDNWRQVAPNDAIWFYVTSDAHIVAGASVRADCGNPNVVTVRPVRPDTPEAPPIDIPPGNPCPYNPALPVDSPECKRNPPGNPPPEEPPPGNTPKDPTEDVLVNPEVPEQVRGPGSTPVGEDPGPAEEPTDSETGCNGPCPAPSTTTTTRPPSSGGGSTPTTVPGCGGSGQPSCGDTGTSPPTTTAPPAPPPPDQPPQDGMPESP